METGTKISAHIGHVHLKVSDIERAVAFYTEALGMEVVARVNDGSAAFLSWDGYHHHLGLNTWLSKGGSPPPRTSTGLFHFAILYPTREALAHAVRRVLKHGVLIDGASDHGVSEALYLNDPDGNGIELYCDRPRDEWQYDNDGNIVMGTFPLDVEALLAL